MTIHIVGLGQDPENLPDHSSGVVEHAQLLFGGPDLLKYFEDHPAEKIPITCPLEPVIERIADECSSGKMVVVLADGDPLFYGIGSTLVNRLGPEDVKIYPGLTTLQTAAAKIKIPWQNIAAVSLHGRTDYAPLFSALVTHDWIAVFTDAKSVPSAIAQTILDKGGEHFLMWILEDLESDKERIQRLPLEQAAGRSFSKRCIVMLERCAPAEVPLGLGTPDSLFVKDKNLITKGPVRAVSIAALRLRPDSLLWDLGAGCGAVGIEASSVCTKGRVFAVEKNADRVAMIRENIRRTGAYLMELVHGHMPDSLTDLPDPDRIFVGGGLKHREGFLEAITTRLKPGGRIVINVVLMASLGRAEQFFKALDWPYSVTLVNSAESETLAGDLHLRAHNPVFVLVADKPKK